MDVVGIVTQREGTFSIMFPDFPMVTAQSSERGALGKEAARTLGEHVRAMRSQRMRVPIARNTAQLRSDPMYERAMDRGDTIEIVRIPD